MSENLLIIFHSFSFTIENCCLSLNVVHALSNHSLTHSLNVSSYGQIMSALMCLSHSFLTDVSICSTTCSTNAEKYMSFDTLRCSRLLSSKSLQRFIKLTPLLARILFLCCLFSGCSLKSAAMLLYFFTFFMDERMFSLRFSSYFFMRLLLSARKSWSILRV